MLILWDIVKKTSVRILPVYESIEKAFIIPDNASFPISKTSRKSTIYAASAGEKGNYKVNQFVLIFFFKE